jgi:hypothetical protein
MEKRSIVARISIFFISFMPFNLLFKHVKYNLIASVYWAVLFLIISDNLGYAFGIPILFYNPEYLGQVSNLSFLLLGFGVGGFIMAFNTYSYVRVGPKYPFLVLVKRPFLKFCKNNALVPILFVTYYLVKTSQFQRIEEFADNSTVFYYSLNFLGGVIGFIALSFIYFFPISNRSLIHVKEAEEETGSSQPVESVLLNTNTKWYSSFFQNNHRTYIYLAKGFQFAKSRSVTHINTGIIRKIYAKNRINTSVFELLTILTFVILGLFSSYKVFETPASTSIMLLLTIVLMLFSALQSWFGRWTYPFIGLMIITMNYLSLNTPFFTFKNYAYGLNYTETDRPDYSIANIKKCASDSIQISASKTNYLLTLQNWKRGTGEEKPKLVIINTSGGGSRSALWTLSVLQKLNASLGRKLESSIHLITGASGGMIGASYFRELLLRSKTNKISDLHSSIYRDKLGSDLLNKLSFSASTNDIFFRYRYFEYNGNEYTKDRGSAFEKHLHENTDYFMDHTLGYYTEKEKSAQIPTIIFSPTIVNDGRRLLISSQNLNFFNENSKVAGNLSNSYENIDYQTFFKNQSPNSVRFSSVMRMNASFPFVMPMVTVPTVPEVQLMDAGIRDNYGAKVAIEFIYTMNDWIKENTSGVIIVQIRDTKKVLGNDPLKRVSMLDKITLPFGNMYKNFTRTQDFDQDELLKVSITNFKFPIDVVSFNLRESRSERISLSWHLTKQEKQKIDLAFGSAMNQKALNRMKKLIGKKNN